MASVTRLPPLPAETRIPTQGTWLIRYNYSGTSFTSKKNDLGEDEAMGNGLNADYTFDDSVAILSETSNKAILSGAYTNGGVSGSESFGSVKTEVQASRVTHRPLLAYSATDNWQIQLIVPVHETDLQVESKFEASPSLKKFAADSKNRGFSKEVKSGFNKVMSDPFAAELENNGYDPVESSRVSEVGDVTLVNRLSGYSDSEIAVTIEQLITAPTGRPKDVNRAIDLPSGDGQWDVGLGLSFDTEPVGWPVGFHFYGSYTAQLPTETERRVPNLGESGLTSDKDDNLEMDLGDVFFAQASTRLRLFSGFYLQGSYAMYTKQRDNYSGSNFKKERYDQMSEGTFSTMDVGQVGLRYRSYEILDQSEETHWSSQVAYAQVISGESVTLADQWQLELSLYF